MSSMRSVALACKISRGGFSDERIFRLRLPEGEYTGMASRYYCWTKKGVPLEEDEPASRQTINGIVAARVLEVKGKDVLVSVPDGEVITVRANQLLQRPARIGAHVPV